ncbi:hypothetical protein ACI8AK_18740 [Geodermatophilus sp. SYSU D00867]
MTGERPGGCRVRVDGDDLDRAACALVVTGAPSTVLGPPEFAAHLREVAARCTAAARAPDAAPSMGA